MTIIASIFLIVSLAALGLAAGWAIFGPGRYTLVERFLYAPVYALSRILWRVELEWIEADPNANAFDGDTAPQGAANTAPQGAANTAPQGAANTAPQGAANTSPQGAANTAPQGAANTAPQGAANTAPQGIKTRDRNRLLADRMQSGAVLVANHCCSLDPFFIQLIAGTRVHWMVAGEYFKTPVVGSLLRAFQAIPTNRGGVDTASTKRAIALAKQGKFVGMFPEGRINRTCSPLLSIRPGAALVALRAGVPMIPIWIEGAPVGPSIFSALFMPAKVRVIVGIPDDWGLQFSKANATKLDAAADGEPANLQREQGDRSISNQWIHRVMLSSLRNSGRTEEAIALAGKKWLEE